MKTEDSLIEKGLLKPLSNLIFHLFILFLFILTPFKVYTQAPETLCDMVIGEWQWDKYGMVYIYPDGTAEHINDGKIQNTGKWLCDIDVLKIKWTVSGWEDRLKINNDGQSMEGRNQYRMNIVATKVGEGGFSSNCSLVVGSWQWDRYGTVNILQDNTTEHYDGGVLRNTGKWACENGQVKIKWTNGGFTDRLRIKSDGKGMIGQNRQGMPIRASKL